MVTDNFDGSIGTLTGNWTVQLGDPFRTGDGFAFGNGSPNNTALWSGTTFLPNHSAEVLGIIGFMGPAVRLSGSGGTASGYIFLVNHTSHDFDGIYRIDGGDVSRVQTFETTFEEGDTLKIEAVGSTFRCYVNGVQVNTDFVDATYSTGAPGLYMSGGAFVDDFVGANITSTVVGIDGEDWTINGSVTYPGTPAEGLLLNSRMVNAIADDENATTVEDWEYPDTNTWDPDRNTSEFIAQLADYKARGMLAFTLGLQGGWPGHVSTGDDQDGIITAFNSDGSLKSAWLDRLEDVIEASDALGMVVILNLFYFGQDHRLTNEAAVVDAVDNICTWLTTTKGYTNVVVEVANESNQHYGHAILQPARVGELIEQVQGYGLLASVSYTGGSIPSNALVAACDFVLLHGNGQNPSAITAMVASVKALSGWPSSPKPIIFNEDPETQFNFDAAILAGVSWGSLVIGDGNYAANAGYQVMPVQWAVNTSAKRAFFDRAQFYAQLWPPGSIIQSATNQTTVNATSVTVTLPRLPIPGTTIIGAHHTRSDSSVAPSGFSEAVAVFNSTEADEGAIYHRVTPQTAGTSFVFGQSPTGDSGAAAVYEVYGIVTTSPVNEVATTGRTTSTTSISSGTTSATSGPTFALAMAAIRNTVTSPGWTNDFTHRHHVTGLPATTEAVLLTATKVVSSAGAVQTTASWTTSRTAMGAVATFTLDVDEAPTFQPAWARGANQVLQPGVH